MSQNFVRGTRENVSKEKINLNTNKQLDLLHTEDNHAHVRLNQEFHTSTC